MGPLPEPYSDDPTQWLFKGNIVGSEQPLHVAIARMLGYRWPEQPVGEDPLDALIDKDGIVCIPPVGANALRGTGSAVSSPLHTGANGPRERRRNS